MRLYRLVSVEAVVSCLRANDCKTNDLLDGLNAPVMSFHRRLLLPQLPCHGRSGKGEPPFHPVAI